ncbi:hypothetical protein EYF80_046607 [Liparis tanakae]|uniref:Uncharacterized protein n=1 Tax=Liparis tanakae TaxID=230148 RepID=A0A4Z2FPN9_9TELE|nr:hypothetical protein EYF80_046607 [Liparis tanakae]
MKKAPPPMLYPCSGQKLRRRAQEHQHHGDVVTGSGGFGVAHQPPSDPQAHGVLRLVGRSVSFGVGGLTEGVQDQARDLRGVHRIEEAVARQQHVVLVARQPGGGAVGFSRHSSGHSVGAIDPPASHEGDAAPEVLDPLLLVLDCLRVSQPGHGQLRPLEQNRHARRAAPQALTAGTNQSLRRLLFTQSHVEVSGGVGRSVHPAVAIEHRKVRTAPCTLEETGEETRRQRRQRRQTDVHPASRKASYLDSKQLSELRQGHVFVLHLPPGVLDGVNGAVEEPRGGGAPRGGRPVPRQRHLDQLVEEETLDGLRLEHWGTAGGRLRTRRVHDVTTPSTNRVGLPTSDSELQTYRRPAAPPPRGPRPPGRSAEVKGRVAAARPAPPGTGGRRGRREHP